MKVDKGVPYKIATAEMPKKAPSFLAQKFASAFRHLSNTHLALKSLVVRLLGMTPKNSSTRTFSEALIDVHDVNHDTQALGSKKSLDRMYGRESVVQALGGKNARAGVPGEDSATPALGDKSTLSQGLINDIFYQDGQPFDGTASPDVDGKSKIYTQGQVTGAYSTNPDGSIKLEKLCKTAGGQDEWRLYTGVQKSLDGSKLILYKKGIPSKIELAPNYSELKIKQGAVGDCYLLAAMTGIFSNPAGNAKLESMFQINENWDLVINFTPDLKTSNSGRASGQSLEALFGLIGRKLFFKTKGFEIDLAQDKDMLAITVNKEKLLSMLNDSTAQAGSTTVAAKTNSLAVIIMEHLVGNMVMAEERMELGQRLSLDVHQGRKGRYVDLVCNLLNYKNEYKEIYGDGHEYILPSQLDELSTHLKYLDERQIGADRANNNGFVTVEYDYGQADATGKIHTRHALTLDSFIKDAAGEIIALNLINPWGTVEQLSIHDAISKNIFLTFYTPR